MLEERVEMILADNIESMKSLAGFIRRGIEAAEGRTVAVFQPWPEMGDRDAGLWPAAFSGVDRLVLVPNAESGGDRRMGSVVTEIYSCFRQQNLPGTPVPYLASSVEGAAAWLSRKLAAGDTVLTGSEDLRVELEANLQGFRKNYGCGDKKDWLKGELADIPALTFQQNASLKNLTTLKVGGEAEWLLEVSEVESLKRALTLFHKVGLPARVLGGGANTLVSDLGVGGAVFLLRGGDFAKLESDNAANVTVGAGVEGAGLMEYLTDRGLSGLEFMEGIPGMTGGWVAGNAGAFREYVGSCVRKIRAVRADGTEVKLSGDDAGFEYRQAANLSELIILEVVLGLRDSSNSVVAAGREGFRRRRLDIRGQCCAGSIFRNPSDDYAGRLLETAGGKFLKIGGAHVIDHHANVVIAGPGATASDVLALIRKMYDCVFDRHGIKLIPEVRIWQDHGTWVF